MVVGCVGTGYVLKVELPVQRRLYAIFVRDVGSPDIHECFCGFTGSQRTLGIWGVTGTLGTWVGQVSCPQTLHEVDGCELGMENTWPSNGNVSN